MLLLQRVHCFDFLEFEESPDPVFDEEMVGVVRARMGSLGDRGDNGCVGIGGLRLSSNKVSSALSRAPADFAVAREA